MFVADKNVCSSSSLHNLCTARAGLNDSSRRSHLSDTWIASTFPLPTRIVPSRISLYEGFPGLPSMADIQFESRTRLVVGFQIGRAQVLSKPGLDRERFRSIDRIEKDQLTTQQIYSFVCFNSNQDWFSTSIIFFCPAKLRVGYTVQKPTCNRL